MAVVALLAVGVVDGAAAPSVDTLVARDRALAGAERRLADDLARDRSSLVATRARAEALRRRYDAQAAMVRARLRAAYAEPAADPVVALLAGDPEEAQARADLARALAQADTRLLSEYRATLAELRSAESRLEKRKRRLAGRQRLLAARRATVRARLRVERRAAAAAAAEDAGLPGLPEGDGAAAAAARGLPAEVLRDRSLPGAPPVDARTGAPVLLDPPVAGPPVTVAVPGRGIVQVTPAVTSRVSGPRRFQGLAAIRGAEAQGRVTASGVPFDPATLVASHRTLPLGALLRLRRGGREVTVRVVDRGPFVASRDLEVSTAAAAALGMRRADVVFVTVLG